MAWPSNPCQHCDGTGPNYLPTRMHDALERGQLFLEKTDHLLRCGRWRVSVASRRIRQLNSGVVRNGPVDFSERVDNRGPVDQEEPAFRWRTFKRRCPRHQQWQPKNLTAGNT